VGPSRVDEVGAGRGVPVWLRLFLLVNVVQDVAIGLSGWLSPTDSLLPLKGLTPLNGRFIASLYLAGGVVILIAALVRRAADVRLALWSFLVITLLVLLMTVAYWHEFTANGGTPWLWMATYVVDPVACAAALVGLRLGPSAQPGVHPSSAMFLIVAAFLGLVGLAMLTAAPDVLQAWPWTLTPLLSRVYAAFLLAFAVAAVLAAGERRTPAVAGIVAGLVVLLCLSLVVSVIHLSRFDDGTPRWIWFGTHGTLLALVAASALRLPRPHRAGTAVGP
jgi:hypothetical protein